jgi:hypothetical protein
LGIQINFRFNVETWQKSYLKKNKSSENTSFHLIPSSSSSKEIVASTQSTQHLPAKCIDFELRGVLNSTQGVMIVNYYKSHNCLNNDIRTILVEIIIQHLITSKINMTVALAENIAKQIQVLFPSELKV